MNILRDVVKIVKQIRGEGNMFKYQSTEVNQLYLMYVLTYKIYFSADHFHWQTRYYIIACHLIGSINSYGASVCSMLYGDKSDLLFLLYVGFIMSLAICVSFLIPLGMHLYSSAIESMLVRIDEILIQRAHTLRHHNSNARRMRSVATKEIVLLFTSYLMFCSVCILDVLFFYEEQKVKNYMYYLFPLPLLEEYGSKVLYFTVNFYIAFGAFLPVTNSIAELVFFNTWATICQEEAMNICNDITIASEALQQYYVTHENIISTREKMAIEQRFVRTLIDSLEALKDIKWIIECQTRHFEILGSIIVVTMFICELAHSYVIIVTDLEPAIKGKEICIYLTTAIVTFIVCQVGEALDNISAHTSFAIYSTPWYLVAPQYRKDILQILCQTQETVCVKLSSIYPINMNYYIRWINLVYSYTNILASTVEK